MLVQEIMHSPVVTVEGHESLESAYARMQAHGIRHLPVLREEQLIGVVTDRDLRLATSSLHPAPLPVHARVASVMSHDPITTTPWEPVEEAARLMHDRKIGCLPVMDGERLAGIITGPDLLDAIIRLTGLAGPSGRIEIRLQNKTGELNQLIHDVSGRNVEILSVMTYPDANKCPCVILRINTLNARTIGQWLRSQGYTVNWPGDRSWSR